MIGRIPEGITRKISVWNSVEIPDIVYQDLHEEHCSYVFWISSNNWFLLVNSKILLFVCILIYVSFCARTRVRHLEESAECHHNHPQCWYLLRVGNQLEDKNAANTVPNDDGLVSLQESSNPSFANDVIKCNKINEQLILESLGRFYR